jgi:hypothetical protein
MLFNAVVSFLDFFVSSVLSVFSGIRTMIVSVLAKIPGGELFISGLDSVVDVSLVTSNIAIMISIIATMFSIWGMMKIIHLIRG